MARADLGMEKKRIDRRRGESNEEFGKEEKTKKNPDFFLSSVSHFSPQHGTHAFYLFIFLPISSRLFIPPPISVPPPSFAFHLLTAVACLLLWAASETWPQAFNH